MKERVFIGVSPFGLYCKVCCKCLGSSYSRVRQHLADKHNSACNSNNLRVLLDEVNLVNSKAQNNQNIYTSYIIPQQESIGYICNCKTEVHSLRAKRAHFAKCGKTITETKFIGTICYRKIPCQDYGWVYPSSGLCTTEEARTTLEPFIREDESLNLHLQIYYPLLRVGNFVEWMGEFIEQRIFSLISVEPR